MTPERPAVLRPASGPADPPSSRPGAGVLGGQVFAFRFDPSAGVQRMPVPGLEHITVASDTVLHWAFYADGPAAVHAPYAGLAVTIDVEFDDGSYLSADDRVRDRYGFAMGAAAQFDAAWALPEQWNADTVSLQPWAGRTGRVMAVLGAPGLAVAAGVEVAGARARGAEAESDAGAEATGAEATGAEARGAEARGAEARGAEAAGAEAEPDAGAEADEDAEADGAGAVEGFVEVVVGRRADTAQLTPAERVDARRGTHAGPRFSRGNTIPAVAAPHGFCFLTPATDASDTRWPYRWSVHDDDRGRRLEALQFSHQPSPWIGDRGVLQLRPFTPSDASDALPVEAAASGAERPVLGPPHAVDAPRIVPGTERAHPFVYQAHLRGGVRVRMTATTHAGAFEAAAAAASTPVGFTVTTPDGAGGFTARDGRHFDGWVPEGPADWGAAPRTFFAGVVHGGTVDADGRIRGTGRVEVRIAQSFLSIAQARQTLAQQMPDAAGFDALRDGLHAQWDALLGAVTLPPLEAAARPWRQLADDEARAQLASALYRLHLYPNTMSENTGTAAAGRLRFADPMVPAAGHHGERTGAPVADGELYVNNGYWDTYRTAWPALVLLDAAGAGRMLDGVLTQWRRGGWMARWSAPGYVDSMVGTSSDQIFADAERWSVAFDHDAAFAGAWRNACEPADDPRRGRKGIARARFTGYVARDVPEGMSWSLENAISDAAIARFARRLADRGGADAARYDAFARYFDNRARSYRLLFDHVHGFFRGRDAAGRFGDAPFDPRVWGGDNVETNAWGMSVAAVHDGAGLAALYGGATGLRAHLDRLFAEPETADAAFAGGYGTVIHEQREARALRSGMCAISNQPAHHIPWIHVHGDRPWQAGQTVHALARRLFTGAMIGQGFPGDEDNGEMSAWWLWAALGLYPLELASGELRIGSPLFDDITVRRAGGGSLRVRAHRAGPDAHLLVRAALDGRDCDRPVLQVDALTGAAGGDDAAGDDAGAAGDAPGPDHVLELWFSSDPDEVAASPLWAAADEPVTAWHPDLTGTGGHPLDLAHTVLFDDGAAPDSGPGSAVSLQPGDTAGWRFAAPRTVTDVTVTAAADATADALTWQAEASDGHWRDIATTHRELLIPGRTTPFRLAEPVTAHAVRVRATTAVTLRQLEVFALDEPSPTTPHPTCNDARKEQSP